VAFKKPDHRPIGTIWSYNLNLVDGHVFVSVFIESNYTGKGYGLDMFVLFVRYLFQAYPIRKVYCEVYEYNQHLTRVEGRFAEHKYFDGKYWDMLRISVSKKHIPIIDRFFS